MTAAASTMPPLNPVMTPLRTAVIGALIVAIGPMSLSLYSPAMPTLVKVFDTTPALLDLTMTTYFFGYAFAQLVCGPLSDAYGRRPVALAFFAFYLLGSVIAIVAPSIEWLLVARIIQGIGVAAGAAVSRALVRDQFSGLDATRIMNLIGLMLAIGPAVSPMVGGIILGLAGWHAIFLAMAFYGVVVLLALGYVARETNQAPDPRRARPKMVLQNYVKLFGNRHYIAPVILLGCTVGGIYTLSPLMPFLLIERLGLSSTGFGFAMLAQTGSYGIGSFFTAWLLKRLSEKAVVRVGLSFLLVAGLGFALGPRLLTLSVPVVLIPVSLLAISMALVMPSTTTQALASVGTLAGAASALMGFAQVGGGLMGSGASALFFRDPVTAFETVVPILIAIALLTAMTMRPPRRSARQDDEHLEDLEIALDPLGVLGVSGDEIEARTHRGKAGAKPRR
jgi:DHA1 family bicyclomycin/chloramphenicol resistance-like MFS transporter